MDDTSTAAAAPPYDALVRGDLVLPDRVLADGWVAARGGVVAAIGSGDPPPPARAVGDHRGMLVLPGLVDGHMHTSSSTGWPGIEGATASAAAGGVTTVVDMPYDVPRPVTDADTLREKVGWVERLAHVDVALYGTIRKRGGVDAVAGLAEAGACAFKLSTYEYDPVRFPRIDGPTMRAAFGEIARTGRMVSVHNEDQELVEALTAEARAAGRTDTIQHALTRPPLAETMADGAIFEIGLETGAHVHMAHSSLARGFEMARDFRAAGGLATGETCVQYLAMDEDDLLRLAGLAKCNPPLRPREEVERLWGALREGLVGYVSTDHAPWPRPRKEYAGDIFDVGAGLTGLQSFAPVVFTLFEERGLPVTLMASLCAERPARFHGLSPKKGAIAVGSDMDLCVLERGDFAFDAAEIRDREDARWSPYHGCPVLARVAAAYLRGVQVWDGRQVRARPGTGRFVPRQHDRAYAGA